MDDHIAENYSEPEHTDDTAASRLSSLLSTVSDVDSAEEVITAQDDEVLNVADTQDEDTLSERSSSTTQTYVSDDENEWKIICGALESKIAALQEDTVIQMRAFEEMQDMLVQAEQKINSMQMSLVQKDMENAKLSDIIENLQIRTMEEFEKQKNELLRSADENLVAAEQLYHASQTKVVHLEAIVEKAYIENAELRERLGKALADLKSTKIVTIDPKEFNHWLKKRLKIITEKFRMEAVDSDLAWMGEENIRYAVDAFETATKIILADEPHFRPLAEHLMIFLEAKNEGSNMQTILSESSVKPEDLDNVEAKALMDLKMEISAEMHFLLQKFQEKQTKEFYEIMWKIMNRLDIFEQKIESGLTERIDYMMDILSSIDGKCSDLEMIKMEVENIDVKVETLFKEFDEFHHDINVANEERKDNLENMKAEQLKLKTTCAYVDYLSGEHMKLEKQMKNIEAHCEKLEKEYRSATVATQTTISIANEANFKCNESGNATTINSVLGETASMMKENEQYGEGSITQGMDYQDKKKNRRMSILGGAKAHFGKKFVKCNPS